MMTMGARLFPNGVTGRHVLVILLGFFGVNVAVGSLFTWLAVSTFPGAGGGSAYQRGLHYNETIARAARQDRLGWLTSAAYDAGRREIRILLTGGDGKPVPGRGIAVRVSRPATDRFDRELELAYRGDGLYTGALVLGSGQWDVQVRVIDQRDGTTAFEAKERLWVPSEG